MIIALAGRRVDAPDAKTARFPPDNVPAVGARLRNLFEREGATALVCAAACGADLVALSEAGALGMKRRIILPFERQRFREASVVDRPGDWGALFDRILDEVEAAGQLVVLHLSSDDEEAYDIASRAILDEAMSVARQASEKAEAVVVWEGASRGEHDHSALFVQEARDRGLSVLEVITTGLDAS